MDQHVNVTTIATPAAFFYSKASTKLSLCSIMWWLLYALALIALFCASLESFILRSLYLPTPTLFRLFPPQEVLPHLPIEGLHMAFLFMYSWIPLTWMWYRRIEWRRREMGERVRDLPDQILIDS